MVRHGDPGVPAWLVDSEEEAHNTSRDREIGFQTEASETQLVTYTVNHSVTLGTLIDDGYLNEDDEMSQDQIQRAIDDYIADGMVDQYDDDEPYYGDSEYYDSNHFVTDWGNN